MYIQNENSYQSMVQKLTEHVRDLNPKTIQGADYAKRGYEKIISSSTPLHDIRLFINNLASENVTDEEIKSACALMRRMIVGASNNVNFQMGIAVEEHIINMAKDGINPEVSLQHIGVDFNQPELVLKQQIQDGQFDSLHSEFFKTVKEKLNITTGFDEVSKTGYNAVVSRVMNHINNTQAPTQKGQKLLESTKQKLFESETPMMVVKEFVTKAEQLVAQDAKLKQSLEFVKKHSLGTDLNYLIGLCKEEHFKNLNRTGGADVDETITEFEKYLNLPSNEIKEYIKQGAFDNLQSNLLKTLKASLGMEVDEEQVAQEAQNLYESCQESLDGLMHYCPVGIAVDDDVHGKVLLVEKNRLVYNKEQDSFDELEGFEPTPVQQNMIQAISELSYDPREEVFELAQTWSDFRMQLDTKDGGIYAQKLVDGYSVGDTIQIQPEHVQQFLMESIMSEQTRNPKFDKAAYIRDADNFVMLSSNRDNLIKFNNFKVIRKATGAADEYVMVDNPNMKTDGISNTMFVNNRKLVFESYSDMVSKANEIVQLPTNRLFADEIKMEHDLLAERGRQLDECLEEQKTLNAKILKCKNMLSIVENGSPAWEMYNKELMGAELELKSCLATIELLTDK